MRKILLAAVALAFASTAGAAGKAVLTPAPDVQFKDVEGFPGVKMAAVQGDPSKGPNHHMLKLPGGFSAPLHHHSPDHYVTVISGTLVLVVDGKETKLPPGSYFAFTGKKPHMTRCDAGADCMLFIDSRGKWDILPEDKAPAKAPAKKM